MANYPFRSGSNTQNAIEICDSDDEENGQRPAVARSRRPPLHAHHLHAHTQSSFPSSRPRRSRNSAPLRPAPAGEIIDLTQDEVVQARAALKFAQPRADAPAAASISHKESHLENVQSWVSGQHPSATRPQPASEDLVNNPQQRQDLDTAPASRTVSAVSPMTNRIPRAPTAPNSQSRNTACPSQPILPAQKGFLPEFEVVSSGARNPQLLSQQQCQSPEAICKGAESKASLTATNNRARTAHVTSPVRQSLEVEPAVMVPNTKRTSRTPVVSDESDVLPTVGDEEPQSSAHREQADVSSIAASKGDHSIPKASVTGSGGNKSSSREWQANKAGLSAEANLAEQTLGLGVPVVHLLPRSIHELRFEAIQPEIKACLKRKFDAIQESHAGFVSTMLRRQRARLNHDSSTMPRNQSLFSDMIPIRANKFGSRGVTGEVVQMSLEKKVAKSSRSVPVTRYKAASVNVPRYSEYVTLQTNFLTESNRKLIYWPWEEHDKELLLSSELAECYDLEMDTRPNSLLQLEKCRVYSSSVDLALAELHISWDHVIFWLLAEEQLIRDSIQVDNTIYGELTAALSTREVYCGKAGKSPLKETDPIFNRRQPNLQDLFSKLPHPSMTELYASAIFCSNFFSIFGFSIWYVARHSDLARSQVFKAAQDTAPTVQIEDDFHYRTWTCRVCHEYNCLFHGEVRDNPVREGSPGPSESQASDTMTPVPVFASDSESDYEESQESGTSEHAASVDGSSDSEEESTDDTGSLSEDYHDVYEEPTINHRLPILGVQRSGLEEFTVPKTGKFNVNDWIAKSKATWDIAKRQPFRPCQHAGTCADAHCSCFKAGILCEKSCGCSLNCQRRYPGCSCKRGKHTSTSVCVAGQCECRKLSRECDADLCGSCGATDILDPVHRYDKEIEKGRCSNVKISKNVPKRTLLGRSQVHGFGLFAGENLQKGDYVGEYMGEIIGKEEGDRRDTIYMHLKTTYTFNLSKDQEVDSTYMGNKLRFINNAKGHHANLEGSALLCNTVVRIGMFAIRNIKAGTELFFDYKYPDEITQTFIRPGQKGPRPVSTTTGNTKAAKKGGSIYTARNSSDATNDKAKRSTSERRVQTEKARHAAHEKQERGLKLRKSGYSGAPAILESGKITERLATARGLRSTNKDDNTSTDHRAGAHLLQGTNTTQYQDYVPESDPEDEDYVEERDRDDDVTQPTSEHDSPATDEQDASERQQSRTKGSNLRNSIGGAVARHKSGMKQTAVASGARNLQSMQHTVSRQSRRKRKRREHDDD